MYVIIVTSANSPSAETQRWAKSLLISIAQDMVTGQVIKAVVTVLVVKLLARRQRVRWERGVRMLIDPLAAQALYVSLYGAEVRIAREASKKKNIRTITVDFYT